MVEEELIDRPHRLLEYLQSDVRFPGIRVRRLSNGGMEMSVVVQGTIKGTASELEFATDPQGHQFVNPGDLPYTELSRMGQGFQTMATAAVASLIVRPTTVCILELWNGNAGGGPSLVIDRLWSHNLVSIANGQFAIWAMVTTVKAAPTTASLTIVGNSGKAYGGLVIPATGTTVVANGWFPWGVNQTSVTATVPGSVAEAQVNGRIIVPPGCSLCLSSVAQTAAVTVCMGASWFEKTFAAINNPLL